MANATNVTNGTSSFSLDTIRSLERSNITTATVCFSLGVALNILNIAVIVHCRRLYHELRLYANVLLVTAVFDLIFITNIIIIVPVLGWIG